ncbi:hypothetical protein [Streptomyces sp. NBC_00191]|uniref:DinB/UmuC family translesion DNA polymerase n=1 Tax=Streptomyces sp. NBC_00191 TaxID=2975674 RepID=UPI0038699C38
MTGRLTMTVRYADRTSTVRTRRLPEPTNNTAAMARRGADAVQCARSLISWAICRGSRCAASR